jgi:hypothetical protein
MSQPAPYSPSHSFLGDEAYASWFPGSELDVELNNVKTTTDQVRANLKLIQRDDGALANGSVTFNSLSPTLQTAGLSPLTTWASGKVYAAPQAVIQGTSLYQCAIGHTSGTFAADLAAGDWTPLANLALLSGTTTVAANQVAAGPVSGAAANPGFRGLVGADMPAPSVSALGGVKSIAAQTSQWINSISTLGAPTLLQPNFTDLLGTISNTQLSVSAPYSTPGVYGTAYIAQGHQLAWLDEAVAFTNLGIYPVTINATNPIIIGASGSTIGSSTVWQTFSVRFTSTALAGSPITVTYTAIGGDTTTTIAQNLCAAINANATLHNAVIGLPIFAQQISGNKFNIQYSAGLQPSGTTPLTLASTGTGTVNLAALVDALDYAAIAIARAGNAQGANAWIPQNGDALIALDFVGHSALAGADNGQDTHYVNLNVNATNVQSGSQIGRFLIATAYHSTTVNGDYYFERGLVGYNSAGSPATGGDQGYSTINLNGGGVFFNGLAAVQPSAGGGTGAGLISIGAPATIAWDNTAGGTNAKWWDALATGNTLSFRLVDDTISTANSWMTVTRSATTPVSIVAATSLTSSSPTGGLGIRWVPGAPLRKPRIRPLA